ncbi:MAG TPA: phosphoenolpyruvate--protein phosphotransferase [Pseudolysinimonas sp.]|nr:phosphoenolpyruvate--protein phosphotransferase [Pseudolysinimonas sp.]
MQVRGFGVGRGSAVGYVRTMTGELPDPTVAPPVQDAATEVVAFRSAVETVAADLNRIAETAHGASRAVIEATVQMVLDPEFAADVERHIAAGAAADQAVGDATAVFRAQLVALGGRFAERAADVDDVTRRVHAVLRGVPIPGLPVSETPYVLVAHDVPPVDAALLDPALVLAVVTRQGGPTGHTAILARAKGIPAVVGVGSGTPLPEGAHVLVEAASGVVTVNPTDEVVAAATATRAARQRRSAAAGDPSHAHGALADGTPVPLFANLTSPDAAAAALALGAEGLGLLRTEFLFAGATAPTVDQQLEQYLGLLRECAGRPVVVRVLDAGGDKPLPYLSLPNEPNPALGMRGLRALRQAPQILRDQLTALARAGAESGADLRVMAPMVADAEEAEFFVTAARDAGLATVGIMAEVPSAAVLAEQLFEVADFISIGTNDLTQYTLAADRTASALAGYQNPWHPAVLRLVQLIGTAGAEAGKEVGICGEAAADPDLSIVLVGLGATSLSMAAPALADVREALAGVTLEQAREVARAALAESSAASARAAAATAVDRTRASA